MSNELIGTIIAAVGVTGYIREYFKQDLPE